jgi:ELWxxDGT repeat protein
VAVDDVLLFAADDGLHGSELWRSDGSSAGTTLVKDVWPGPATADASPGLLTALDETLVFVADDGRAGPVLWSTDGTERGTVPVAALHDIDAGTPAHVSTRALAELGDRLFFGADDRVAGNELWSSDGTTAGTALVKDIWPGADSALPGELTPVGEVLFFAADDGTHGRELWKSDGTGGGTALVKDIVPGLGRSSPTQLTAVAGRLFFAVGTDRGNQLWVSDGTAAGTLHVRDFFHGSNFTDLGGALYFTTGTSLWKSDGTAAGTAMVADFHPVSGQYTPNSLTSAGGRLFFLAKEPGGSTVRLWSTDGERLAALVALGQFAVSDLTSAGGRVFFSASDAEHGQELWTSDGSEAGTQLVRDIYPGPVGSTPGGLSAGPGGLLFRACDADACRLWRSDGTEAGTRPFAGLAFAAPPAMERRAGPSSTVAGLAVRLQSRPIVAAGALAYFAGMDFTYGLELRAAALSGGCTGDCDGDGLVTIVELVRMVHLALGDAAVSCPAGVPGDTHVSIDVLMMAVNAALLGCS